MVSEKKKMALYCIVVIYLVMGSEASMQQDEQECADEITTLTSCIPYVSGSAKKPTPECCQDTQKVKSNKPKCLCVLIKESSDPSMGLPVNTTLALQMPSACNIDTKVSNCPSLLKLPADSPDAKIFKEAAGSSDSATTDNSPQTSSNSSTTAATDSTSNTGSKATSSSNNAANKKILGGGILMAFSAWIFMLL